ncbi:hypothetical protein A2999_01385 [Candidatus Wolfebacteria bacterium RIFCSPLOWO2_01_FULL_38_11]|uniref:HTH luxR-type domain-containing protein n=1 Tax=Candidatus Wolfebacteria bacterium RIFCSPLOWO2_01_FULL_38_11 TaxID=1802556 RepID=A0A1F8DP94_9BACT|nr:MAG: hypothetical protein A2999_01385 [Candidatus Wolfebacteria bacterium RIFCSPLOWO2_01_FULL_38_11]
MESFSNFKSRKEWEEFIWQKFTERLKNTKTSEQLKEILESVLGSREKNFMIKRLIAIALISQNKTYREIGEIIWLSPNTISSVKKNLFRKSIYSGYKKSDIKFDKNNKKKISKKEWADAALDLLNLFDRIPLPPMGKGRWRFLDMDYQDRIKYGRKR